MSRSTSVRFNEDQRRKLRELADALSTSPNAIVGMLVDYAQIEPVTTMTAVSKLPTKANGHSVQLSTEDATAIHA